MTINMKNTNQIKKSREKLMLHCQTHPKLQPQDLFKFIYQSSFGCEHMVSSSESVTNYIIEELNRGVTNSCPYIEPLDGDYSRVNLSYLNTGLSVQTLGRLFFLSAKKEPDGENELKNKLNTAKELMSEKLLPFAEANFEKQAKQWKALGYPAVHHSAEYKEKYAPSYRVIANRYIAFLPLFAEIDKRLSKGAVRIAVEGKSASGKTTLGKILKEIYGCTVFHTDDFFLRPEQRTPERYAEIGGNIDRERFIDEVLIPLSKDETVNYRKFDCSEMKLQAPTKIKPEKLTVIEGSYSMHPEFEGYYNFSVFLDISPQLQKERILKRNSPQMAERFFNEWIPLENTYFFATDIKKRCEMCITIAPQA